MTGALGALIGSGNIKSVTDVEKSRPNDNNAKQLDGREQRLQDMASPPSSPKKDHKLVKKSKLNSQSTNKSNEQLIRLKVSDCQPWGFADRHEGEMGDLDSLAESMLNHSQQEPILVRPITKKNNTNVKYEIIFGHRRWRAAQIANIDLLAIVKDLSDQEAAIAQKEENGNREDISDYSKAIFYKNLLDKKVFDSQGELAIKLGVSKQALSDLLAYTRLPQELLDAYPDVHKLNLKSAVAITSYLNKHPAAIKRILEVIPQIANGKLTTRRLKTLLENGKLEQELDEAVKFTTPDGNLLFSLRKDSNGSPNLVFQKSVRDRLDIVELSKKIRDMIEDMLRTKN